MSRVQAKGLEFEDVFVVNFFKHGTCGDKWRTLLEVSMARAPQPQCNALHDAELQSCF